MLRNIEISGLRHFSGYVVQVDGLCVFYGKNGAGKSSIATAFEMLSAIAGRSLGDWTEVFGNCGALFISGRSVRRRLFFRCSGDASRTVPFLSGIQRMRNG